MTKDKVRFAKGSTLNSTSYKIFYGNPKDVERSVQREKSRHWAINFYKTQEELDHYIEIDREFFGDDLEGVEFIKV